MLELVTPPAAPIARHMPTAVTESVGWLCLKHLVQVAFVGSVLLFVVRGGRDPWTGLLAVAIALSLLAVVTIMDRNRFLDGARAIEASDATDAVLQAAAATRQLTVAVQAAPYALHPQMQAPPVEPAMSTYLSMPSQAVAGAPQAPAGQQFRPPQLAFTAQHVALPGGSAAAWQPPQQAVQQRAVPALSMYGTQLPQRVGLAPLVDEMAAAMPSRIEVT